MTLYDQLLKTSSLSNDALLDAFLDYTTSRKLELYPAQEEAVLELYAEKNLILNTPTGSGKSLVASALHFKSLAQGKRSVYTCPIKALVNEKWISLCREFGPENVGLSTGDATVNHDAPILCCTAEILANIALRDGPRAKVHDVVMDEFHYYSDRERGVAWQVPLLTLPQTRFLLMSATLGETGFFEEQLTRLNSKPTVTVKSTTRPVPLDFSYAETPLAQTLEKLIADSKGPVYVVHFTQNEAAQSAQDFTSINVASRDEKAAIASALEQRRFNSPYGTEIKRWLRAGIGLHHAGLLPKYRILVEQLAQQGLLKVICGTDTLGVGINVPIRTVLFTRLSKYGGDKVSILSARDFHQIAGRAGRKGYDNVGWVVAQAPEHVIENLKLEEKSKRDGKKIVKRQAPEGFVGWDKKTFERLQSAAPERLSSRFQVSHAMLLNVLSRPDDGCTAMRELIRQSHESDRSKKAHRIRAWQLFRSLVDRRIVEFVPPGTDPTRTSKLRVNVELPEDFSLNHELSLFLLDTLPLLDKEAPDYPLDLITLIEAILEDPDAILRRQLDKLKGAKVAELKAQGMEYNERMEELEKLEHPKPRSEFIYPLFNAWAEKHPWVGQENIRLKSIAREMFEDFRSFGDYIRIYELQRGEGVLLRHLNSVYKVLAQTIPAAAKTDAVLEMEAFLKTMLQQVDSSLLDEWERMRNPAAAAKPADTGSAEIKPPGAELAAADITRDTRAFTASVRARIFSFLRAWSNGDFEAALELLPSAGSPAEPWSTPRLEKALTEYEKEHERVCLDPEARNVRHTYIKKIPEQNAWNVQQVLVDPDAANDWVVEFHADLAAAKAAREPVLHLVAIRPVAPLHASPDPTPDAVPEPPPTAGEAAHPATPPAPPPAS